MLGVGNKGSYYSVLCLIFLNFSLLCVRIKWDLCCD